LPTGAPLLPQLHTPGRNDLKGMGLIWHRKQLLSVVRKRSWTDRELEEAVKESTSYRQVLLRLNLRAAGGNYKQLKQHMKRVGLAAMHFTGQSWRRGKHVRFPTGPVARRNPDAGQRLPELQAETAALCGQPETAFV